jgi:hypothetical protein
MRKPLNFELMIAEGAEGWREVRRSIDAAEKLVAAASNDPASLIALAQAVFLFVRYKQNELQSYLRVPVGSRVQKLNGLRFCALLTESGTERLELARA